MKRPPIKFIIRIDEDRLSELIYCWNWYDKPCDLLFRKPKTEGLAAVVLTVDSDEAADFLLRVKEKTGARLYQMDKKL